MNNQTTQFQIVTSQQFQDNNYCEVYQFLKNLNYEYLYESFKGRSSKRFHI